MSCTLVPYSTFVYPNSVRSGFCVDIQVLYLNIAHLCVMRITFMRFSYASFPWHLGPLPRSGPILSRRPRLPLCPGRGTSSPVRSRNQQTLMPFSQPSVVSSNADILCMLKPVECLWFPLGLDYWSLKPRLLPSTPSFVCLFRLEVCTSGVGRSPWRAQPHTHAVITADRQSPTRCESTTSISMDDPKDHLPWALG